MNDSPLPVEGGESSPPETPAEAPPDYPNITCKRCGTVTNWNPYCPTCGAYLEFMGVPAWTPTEVTSTVPAPKAPAEAPVEAPVDVPAEVPVPQEPAESAEAATPDPTPPADAHHHWRGLHLGHHDESDPGQGDEPVNTKPVPWWAFWRRPKAAKELDPASLAATVDPESTSDTEDDPSLSSNASIVAEAEVNVVAAHPTVDVVAELPQAEQERQQRTRRSVNAEAQVQGISVQCSHCGHENPVDHAYCEWCGSYLSTYRLAPAPPTVSEATGANQGTEAHSSPVRQAWRKSYLLYVILALVALLIWFFFWGPMASATRSWFKEASQTVSEFIFPKLGEEAAVASIVASSSLPGTSATSLNQANSVDYWASAELAGLGVGTTITFTFAQCYAVDRLVVAPGTQDSDLDVQALAQPKNLSMTFSPGGTTETALLLAPTSNSLYVQTASFPKTYATSVTISIDSVYPSRYVIEPDPTFGSVAISSLNFLQSPSASTITILNPINLEPTASSSSTASAAPAPSGAGTGSASPSGTPSPTAAPCVSPDASPSASPSATPSATPSASPSATPSPSGTKDQPA